MTAFTTVSINNNLTTSQTCITMRTTNHELTRWIDKILDIVVEQGKYFLRCYLCLYTWHKDFKYILMNLLYHLFISLQLCLT